MPEETDGVVGPGAAAQGAWERFGTAATDGAATDGAATDGAAADGAGDPDREGEHQRVAPMSTKTGSMAPSVLVLRRGRRHRVFLSGLAAASPAPFPSWRMRCSRWHRAGAAVSCRAVVAAR